MKPVIKFNSGNGAILCNMCRIILKENLTEEEWNGNTDLLLCEGCQMENEDIKREYTIK